MFDPGYVRNIICRLECSVLAVSVLFGSLVMSGCAVRTTETSEEPSASMETSVTAEADKETEPSATSEPEEDQDKASTVTEETEPEPVITPDPKPQALEAAGKLGIDEEQLRGRYDLFLKFVDVVDANQGLDGFEGYVYRLFPLVAEHLDTGNEDYFLNKLLNLSISIVDTDAFAGGFMPWSNSIEIKSDIKKIWGKGFYALTVYHELIHFIDEHIDGQLTYVNIPEYGDIYESCDEPADPNTGVIRMVQANYWVEGGAEKYSAEYLTHAPSAEAYRMNEQFLVGMEYIFGTKTVDDMFFAHDTDWQFVELLRKNGFSDDEIVRLFDTMTLLSDSKQKEYHDPREALIRIYVNQVGPDYENDKIFCRIIASMQMEKDFLKKIPSDYRKFISKQKRFSAKEEKKMCNYIAKKTGKKDIVFDIRPTPLYVEGELKLVGLIRSSQGKDFRTVVFDYDFENNSIKDCTVYDDLVPVYTPSKFASDDLPEAKQFIRDNMRDNSAAHNQKVKGAKERFAELYDRAEQIGNRYGIQILFADLVPEGILLDTDLPVTNKGDISDALDQIENVLSQYPEDYFDQLLFKPYSGVVIYMYTGFFNEAHSDTVFIDGRIYLAMSYCIDLPRAQGSFAVNAVRDQYFKDIRPVETQMICDIWNLTEKSISDRNSYFEKTSVNGKTWAATNYKGFKYAGSEEDGKIKSLEGKAKMDYFLSRESLSSAKTDRTLLYQYMMMSAMSGTNPLELTDECRAKAEELCRAVRTVFNTDKWPDKTSWEKVLD